jgi:hypothetical protein
MPVSGFTSLIIVEMLGMSVSGFTSLIIVEMLGMPVSGFTSLIIVETSETTYWHPSISTIIRLVKPLAGIPRISTIIGLAFQASPQ